MSAQTLTLHRPRNPAAAGLKYLLAVALSLIIVIPLVAAVLGGFKSNADLQNNSFGLPSVFVWSNYTDILTSLTFWQQLLNSTTVMVATAVGVVVLTMVSSWNAFFLPLLVLNNTALWTLPLGIMQFQGQFGADWSKILAFVSLALVPTVVFYLLAEKQIVTGLTAGAVKG